MFDVWVCPSCGYRNKVGILTKRVCKQCGFSREKPKEDTGMGYY